MVAFTVGFCFILLCILCIATLIRGWKAYCILAVLIPTFTILAPFKPVMTVLLIWYFAIIVPLLVMIYYGDKGRAAFENFMSNDVGTKGEELIKRFQNWNQ